jgi:hypothetical protein
MPHNQQQANAEDIETFTLESMETKIINLGTFRYDRPNPAFRFIYSDGTESDISADPFKSRLDSQRYKLYYSFLNYGSKPSTVSIRTA